MKTCFRIRTAVWRQLSARKRLSWTTPLRSFTTGGSKTRDVWKEWLSAERESEAVETAKRLLSGHGAYINGWVTESSNGSRFDVKDPATGQTIMDLPNLNATDTKNAITAASDALRHWRALPPSVRCDFAYQIFIRISLYSESLARILSIESGKPLSEARGEIKYGASFFRWFAEEGRRHYGDVIPSNADSRRIVTLRQPLGVCGLITPWNFPLAMIARKLAPALVTGCTSVFKPAPQTPLTAVAMCRIIEDCGVPPGVVNMVTADVDNSKAVGKEMCDSFAVRKLSFTGSTAAGVALTQQCAATMKRVSMELGGHAPFVVFDDANVDDAVVGAMASKFRNSGQTCISANRFYIHDKVYDEFSAKFKEAVEKLQVGHGFDEGTKVGPLIDSVGIAKSEAHVNDAVSKGATVLTGGSQRQIEGLLSGAFFEPTIVDNVPKDAVICSQETFGPVCPLFRFTEESEVVEMANDTEVGLMGYFYSNDLSRVWRVAEALEYGMVAVNSGLISTEIAPFGGVKMSGLGREGGQQGIDEYTNVKYICMDNLKGT